MGQDQNFADVLKARTPLPVRRVSRRLKQWLKDRRNRLAPARDVFTEIYEKQLWGSTNGSNFYSGPGSDAGSAAPYRDFVKAFIAEHGIKSVVDLGCGDFRVGGMIAPSCERYTGVDVVDSLIAGNRQRHGGGVVFFECLDITRDPLPSGDLCLIREVLQHLSNAQIQQILVRTRIYPFVLITDVQPDDASQFRINRDKIHGASSRIVYRSVLRLDKAPFQVPGVTQVFETSALFSPDYAPFGTGFKLRTYLIRH